MIVLFLLVMKILVVYSQDLHQNHKNEYLSYFGNDSTNINITHVPCRSADYIVNLSGVIYNRDTIRINGNLYYYRAPQPLDLISEPVPHFLFPRQDTLFLREERESGRLYRYYRNYFGTGETEKLICDMTLEVGDEFVYPSPGYLCLHEETFVVYQVNYDNGIKTIHITSGDMGYETSFEEGRLPLAFPLWQEQLYEWSTDETGAMNSSELLCEYKDGKLIYGNTCYVNPLSINETNTKPVSIYPSIIRYDDVITIESSDHINEIVMIDMFGRTQEVMANKVENYKWQINMCKNHMQGIHFIIIITEKGISYEKVLLLD